MSRPKPKKAGVFFPEHQEGGKNRNKRLTPEQRNTIFQSAMRDKSFIQLGLEYKKNAKSIERICYRIASNGNKEMNQKIHFVKREGNRLLSINQVASQFIEYQLYLVKKKRTVEEVSKLIGASKKLIKDHIRSKGWGQTKAQLGAFEDED